MSFFFFRNGASFLYVSVFLLSLFHTLKFCSETIQLWSLNLIYIRVMCYYIVRLRIRLSALILPLFIYFSLFSWSIALCKCQIANLLGHSKINQDKAPTLIYVLLPLFFGNNDLLKLQIWGKRSSQMCSNVYRYQDT